MILKNFKTFKDISVETIKKRKLRNIDNICKYWLWILDDYLGGIVENELVVIAAWPWVWKAQPLSSKLLTDNWWISMWNIKLWDNIFWWDWKLTEVIWVYPQWEKDIYEIIFNDWTKTRCCLDHLWTVQDRNQRKKMCPWYKYNITKPLYSTIRIKDIIDNLVSWWRLNYSIDLNMPIRFSKKDIKIDPYILWVLLWDWIITNKVSFSNSEEDIIEKVKSKLIDWDYITQYKDKRSKAINNRICNNKQWELTNIYYELKSLWLLWKKSYNKFIPKEYLESSIENRIELLQWLCDTDWYVLLWRDKKQWACIEYSTVSKQLAEWIEFLVRSLWWFVTYKEKLSWYKKDWLYIETKNHYRMYLNLPNWITPVSSEKHLSRYKEATRKPIKFIKEINFIRKELAQCIMVNNKDHLYITDNFTVTHNTDLSVNIALSNAMRWKKVALFLLEWDVWEITYRYFQREINKKIMKDKWKVMRWPEYRLNLRTDIEELEREVYNELPEEMDNLMIFDKSFIPNREALLQMLKDTYQQVDLFVIDHLHYLDFWDNEYSWISEIVKWVKEMTELMERPIVLVSHLSRKNSENKRLPNISDLHWSSNIEKNANTIILLTPDVQNEYIDARQDKSYLRPTKMIVGKNRTWMPVPAIFDITYDLRTKEYRKDAELNSLSTDEKNRITLEDKIW